MKHPLPTRPDRRILAHIPACGQCPSRTSVATSLTAIALVALVRLPFCVLLSSFMSSIPCLLLFQGSTLPSPPVDHEFPLSSCDDLPVLCFSEARSTYS